MKQLEPPDDPMRILKHQNSRVDEPIAILEPPDDPMRILKPVCQHGSEYIRFS